MFFGTVFFGTALLVGTAMLMGTAMLIGTSAGARVASFVHTFE
ncbi:putative membrane protein [Rhodococcus sp. MTM3W5.2]|nr:putative membrane protein [Rhodococcus sp. MTM3W5.2]